MPETKKANARPIEDYAVLGDGHSAALVARDGDLDWLCWPRFDSPACFAALLGTPSHGRWRLTPAGKVKTTRAYRNGTLILETEHRTTRGAVRVSDFMPVGPGKHVVRIVEGLEGSVAMRMELALRFDYGAAQPWLVRTENAEIRLVSGPDKVVLRTQVPVDIEDDTVLAAFTVKAGGSAAFALSYGPSHEPDPAPIEPHAALSETERRSLDWARRFAGGTPWDAVVERSLLTLKALIYQPTGGIVAAPTTSLPEAIGGPRNWDYRYCWLRDSAFTLTALLDAGYVEEARAWQQWLMRSAAGAPDNVRILYGIAGERLIPEIELDWLPGYARSQPVRIGNAASAQFQLDVYGEVFDAMYRSIDRGLHRSEESWRRVQPLLVFLEEAWRRPDEGIWEVRGGRRHFVHSKVMAWVAFDRAIRIYGDEAGPELLGHWERVRGAIHAEICKKGFNRKLNSFVQSYGSDDLDASVLLMFHMGFLPADDPRMIGTVEAIGRQLMKDGFVLRYATEGGKVDGLAGGEGAFLPCSFWYADSLVAQGRLDEARALIERLIGVLNDVGLISEEYDPVERRMLGNFPQAFSHVALVNSVIGYSRAAAAAGGRS